MSNLAKMDYKEMWALFSWKREEHVQIVSFDNILIKYVNFSRAK